MRVGRTFHLPDGKDHRGPGAACLPGYRCVDSRKPHAYHGSSNGRREGGFLYLGSGMGAMSKPLAATGPKGSPVSKGPSPAVMATYARQDVVFERGEGSWLLTAEGDRYLDFGSGVAVNALGHAHPRLVAALTAQAQKLWHTSNLYRVAGQEALAERLVAATFADKVFFCNSGAEACEGAIKAARRYHYVSGQPERWRIITFLGAFHGRTLATLAAAGNEKYLEGFGPELAGFDHIPYGDLEAVAAAIGPETAAIMLEPIQGEGGVREPSPGVPARPARPLRPARPAAGSRRGSDRGRPHPASCSPTSGPASRRTSWPSPRASAAASRWARCWQRTKPPRA